MKINEFQSDISKIKIKQYIEHLYGTVEEILDIYPDVNSTAMIVSFKLEGIENPIEMHMDSMTFELGVATVPESPEATDRKEQLQEDLEDEFEDKYGNRLKENNK